MKGVVCIILSGGEGTRLHPLTLTRCKPAVNFGGKYRLIDVPLSHAIHANCQKIVVLTQFLSSSLHHHIVHTYMRCNRVSVPIEILTAEQKPSHKNWFQGTADAVRQNLDTLLESDAEYFLILSGDQLYHLNFQDMLNCAYKTGAEVVVAALPVDIPDAYRMGVLAVDPAGMIIDFCEKPPNVSALQDFYSHRPCAWRASHSSRDAIPPCLGSMGIYLFKRHALARLLREDVREDFGKHLIPTHVTQGGVAAFLYDGYWEDIGTIQAFYEANMALMAPQAKFNLHRQSSPLLTSDAFLPPARVSGTQVTDSMVCEGSLVEAAELTQSILGPRSVVNRGAVIRTSYLMGNDYYYVDRGDPSSSSRPHVGEGSLLVKTIVDKNATIGKGVQLVNKHHLQFYDGPYCCIRDGIIIVPPGVHVPDGFIL